MKGLVLVRFFSRPEKVFGCLVTEADILPYVIYFVLLLEIILFSLKELFFFYILSLITYKY